MTDSGPTGTSLAVGIAGRKPGSPGGRLDRGLEGLEAGQFWRAAEDVAAYGGNDHRRDAVRAGTVLLVQDLRFVDGFLHTVILAPHPTETAGRGRRFLVEDFLTSFSPAADAEEVRAAEIAAVNSDIARIQSEMLEGPPQVAALPAPEAEPTDVSTMVALATRSGSFEQRSLEMRRNAETHRDWITLKTGEITERATLLTRFFTERSLAAQAAISETMARAARLERGAKSLGLYTGEGIGVTTLVEGRDAPAGEPLTIYQRRLFMDEETAVEFGSAGVDADGMEELADAFARAPGLIDRIAPSPRAVVLMRLRRRDASFGRAGGRSLSDLFRDLERSRLDQQSFLLVRNGGNVQLVHSDLIWSFEGASDDFDANGLKRLFPSTDDLDRPFRGAGGRSISMGDLDFTDARRRFDDRSLAYKRLLVLMWGLSDRLGLFGREWAGPADWTDMAWQAEHFRFVADDGLALEVARESWDRFAARNNALLQAGSRVWVEWKELIDPDVVPSLYRERDIEAARDSRWNQAPYCAWRPTEEAGVTVVGRSKGVAAIRMALENKTTGATRNTWVPISVLAGTGLSTHLCLDAVGASDLDWYVENRKDRESYAAFLELFIGARKFLREDEARQEPGVAAVLRALAGAGVDTQAPEAREVVADAVRLWRAANGAADVPSRQGDRKAFERVLSLAWIGVGRDIDFRAALDDLTRRTGIVPLRLSVDGDGVFRLYAETPEAERLDVLGEHVWVSRHRLARTPSGFGFDGDPQTVRMRETVASERPLVDLEARHAWIGRKSLDGGVRWDQLVAALDDIAAVGAEEIRAFSEGREAPLDHAALHGRMAKGGQLHPTYDVVPVGIAVFARQHDYSYSPTLPDPMVLVLRDDALYLRARAGGEGLADARNYVFRRYENPRTRLPDIDLSLKMPTARLEAIPLRLWRPGTRSDVHGRTVCAAPWNAAEGIVGPSKASDWRDAVHAKSRLELDDSPRRRLAATDEVVRLMRPEAAEALERLRVAWSKDDALDADAPDMASPRP